jgi:hypothetical protein
MVNLNVVIPADGDELYELIVRLEELLRRAKDGESGLTERIEILERSCGIRKPFLTKDEMEELKARTGQPE